MFSKKPQFATQPAMGTPAKPSDGRLKRLLTAPVRNPVLGLAAAGVLLAASVAVLILTGDPSAGLPSVRVALGPDGAQTPQGADASAAVGDFDPNAIAMVPLDQMDGQESPYGGTAVITLPNGEQQQVVIGASANPLPPAPIAGLSQPGPGGLLPVIAPDGRTPAQAYARPFTPNGKPKVAVIVGGLGINPATTRKAIETLPPDVTLSFAVSEVDGLQSWINLARAYGHEVMLELPMEPKTFPQDDPGPATLMAAAPPEDTLRRLDALLARAAGYFGVTNYMGSKFLTSNNAMDAFSTGIRRRGLAFIDDGQGAQRGGGILRASADRIIDEQPGPDAITYQLTQVEQSAKSRGSAIASGMAYDVTIRQVTDWARGLDQRGFQLAPASALTVRR